MYRPIILPLLVGTIGIITVGGGVYLWRGSVIEKREKADQVLVEKLLKDGHADEAVAFAQVRADKASDPKRKATWQAAEVRALVEAGDAAHLVTLYRNAPELILKNEHASVLTARALQFASGEATSAEKVTASWKGRAAHPDWWASLQADTLLATGKRAEAERFLKSQHFPGKADTGRLLRLASLRDRTTTKGLQAAWADVQAAYALDPTDPDVRSYRGQMLEGLGRSGEARVEYIAARVARPQSPLYCDTLALFYQRQGKPALALQTWAQGLTSCPADFLALKTFFSGRTTNPLTVAGADTAKTLKTSVGRLSESPLTALMRFLVALPDDQFFDETHFDEVPDAFALSQSRPEVLYLRICNNLKQGQESAAWQLVSEATKRPEAVALNPSLVRALAQLLEYRKNGSFAGLADKVLPAPVSDGHPLLRLLDAVVSGKQTLDAPTQRFLKSDEAFAAVFLATGWWEAALKLRPHGETATIASGAPSWYSYGLIQALRANRDNQTALTFALQQNGTLPAEQVLKGEMLLMTGRMQEGEAVLAKLATAQSDAGMRAAWILARGAVEAQNAPQAEKWLRLQPRLANEVLGKELTARIALLKGDKMGAVRLYRSIIGESVEADAFLAGWAFELGDLKTARSLTLHLLEVMPEAVSLRKSLDDIDAAIAAQKGKRG